MKKYLIAAVLVVSFAAPAFAEQFYVAFDHANHKMTGCREDQDYAPAPMWRSIAPSGYQGTTTSFRKDPGDA